ncbi:MAG: protease complex subunit PrcB family protein, partial [Acidobacteria bacterium]|nr:protease complex subunit PrcB family protein [Acidobacteriota bacterium]MCA1639590.1 protease complex subunit PrcB family protein [Acidobacteriota bacterium]
GYSVDIRKSASKILLEVVAPPKGAMLTQALTTPYKIALVPVEQEMNLPLEVSTNWKNAAQIYRVTKGEFESSGGFAGRIEKFDAEGTISVISFGDYATLTFNLTGKRTQNTRKLFETASGTLKEGKIELIQLNAGSFSEGPKPPLKAIGTLTKDKLSLIFESLPSRVADGFQVRGAIEAVKFK